jgi:hypothetical protein
MTSVAIGGSILEAERVLPTDKLERVDSDGIIRGRREHTVSGPDGGVTSVLTWTMKPLPN